MRNWVLFPGYRERTSKNGPDLTLSCWKGGLADIFPVFVSAIFKSHCVATYSFLSFITQMAQSLGSELFRQGGGMQDSSVRCPA